MEKKCYRTLLQEYVQKKNLTSPHILPREVEAKGRSFQVRLIVNDKSVTGEGKTKLEAEEDAAKLMYKILIEEDKRRASNELKVSSLDPVEELMRYCSIHNLDKPKFECESIKNTSHNTTFNIKCKLYELTEEVRCLKKSKAMKQAARNMLQTLLEQEKVHNLYKYLYERKDPLTSPEGSANEVVDNDLLIQVRQIQFKEYLKHSLTAKLLKTKPISYIDEIKDPETMFTRICKEMGVNYTINFNFEDPVWVCIIHLKSLFYKRIAMDNNKIQAGKSAVRGVLKYMHYL